MKTLFLAAFGLLLAASPAGAELIYRFSGVYDNLTGGDAGVRTVFHCTNFTDSAQRVRVALFAPDGALAASRSVSIEAGDTRTFATLATSLFEESLLEWTTFWSLTSGKIFATDAGVTCSAMVITGNLSPPGFGASLHMQRFNPVPNTQE